jgi:hypothetical protein
MCHFEELSSRADATRLWSLESRDLRFAGSGSIGFPYTDDKVGSLPGPPPSVWGALPRTSSLRQAQGRLWAKLSRPARRDGSTAGSSWRTNYLCFGDVRQLGTQILYHLPGLD